MSKIAYCGMESQGKSLLLGDRTRKLLKRNKKYFKKYGFKRLLRSNLKLSNDLSEYYKDFIVYWDDVSEIIGKTGCDIIWDEISTDLSAQKREPLPPEINKWLRQGAKQGVHIYATAQEFHDIHLDFRRRVAEAYIVRKLLGSERGGENLPTVKWIWGICMYRKLKINPYNELEPEYRDVIPRFFWIDKDRCSVFDTHQVILTSEEIPLQHIERKCLKCGLKKTIHR
jgi:hypothetical protein